MTRSVTTDVRGVWKRYSRSAGWVLRDIDLTVEAGNVVVVLGGNGDGKSTLLRIVAGVAGVTRGQVRRPRRSVSYLPERLPAELRMTAGQYLKHMAGLRGRQAGPALERSMELLELLQLAPGPDVPVTRLSKGNRQKVSLAQAFGFPAELTVLDEPFSGLDEKAAGVLTSLLGSARAEGRSVLVSAHQRPALEQCDVVHRLNAGRLEAVAPSMIGDSPRNEDPGHDRSRQVSLVLRAVRQPAGSASLSGVAGVRSVHTDSVNAQVVVVTSDPDGLLLSALPGGWSFVRGEPLRIDAVDAVEAGEAR